MIQKEEVYLAPSLLLSYLQLSKAVPLCSGVQKLKHDLEQTLGVVEPYHRTIVHALNLYI